MTLNPECRATPAAPALADEKFLEGRAAVFYNSADPGTEFRFKMTSPSNPKGDPIEVRERIMPGAFDLAVAQDDVRCLYNHEGLLGRRSPGRSANTLALTVDAQGLNYRCELPSHALGQQVKESLSRGDLDGSSFQFLPRIPLTLSPGGKSRHIWSASCGHCGSSMSLRSISQRIRPHPPG